MSSGATDFEPKNPLDDQCYWIIDVSNPLKPFEAGRWWYPGTRVGDPEPEPTRLPKQFETGFRAHNTNVFPQRPDRAYIGYIDGGAFVLDISDKSNIKVVSKWNHSPPFNGFIHTVLPLFDRGLWIVSDECVRDNGADWPKLVRALDARQEGNPAPISTFPTPSYKAFAKRSGRFGAHNLHENLLASVWTTGAGSANPVVSMMTRSNSGISPEWWRANKSLKVSCISVLTEQQIHPLASNEMFSEDLVTKSLSIPISPISLMTTATRFMSGCSSNFEISVVLPLPKNPVMTVIGIFPDRGSLWNDSVVLYVHFKNVKAATKSINCVNNTSIINKYIVQLNCSRWAQLRGAENIALSLMVKIDLYSVINLGLSSAKVNARTLSFLGTFLNDDNDHTPNISATFLKSTIAISKPTHFDFKSHSHGRQHRSHLNFSQLLEGQIYWESKVF